MIFNSNKKDINSHDVLADLFEGKNVKQAMKAAKSVSFNSEIEKFLAEALICLREITGEKNPVFCDRKINSKNGDILLNRAFDWFETARKSAKTGSDEEMSLVREIMFSEYVLKCFIMGASENKGCCLYSIVYGINSRQQGNQQSFNDSFFEKAFAGAGDAGVSEEILRAYREELRDATAVSNSQGAAEVKTVTVNQGGGKDSSEAKMIFEEDCFQNENNLSTAQNTTIAAADRNNKEKDASNKSEPRGEFKRIEIDGDLFEGYFINGKENGRGKYTWANGDVYDGMWKDGKRCGRGRISWSNGASFDGEWHDGKKHGRGTYTWADGTYYEGEFADGNFNGFGKKVYSSGDVYEGQWKDDKRTGKGRITWSNGDTYEGEWKDDKRCGRGKLIQYGKVPATGEPYMKYSYDGEWLDSKEHGHGICVEGDFGMEKMDKVLEGEWVKGKRQGRFVWYLTNSKGGRYIDFYEDGNLIETCIPYDESIKTVEDARRARALADGKSSSTTPVYTNSSPAAAQDSADTADDFEWEEFSSVGELHEKLLRPELFRDPEDRYLLNSCMYLDTFVDEFHEEFTDGDYAETKEIIAEILGVESGELTENIERSLDFIHGFTEKEYLLAAMYSLAYDERTDLAPYLANLACYLWTDTGDGDYLDPLLDLFRMSGEYDDDDSTWLCAILRLRENGNIDDPLKPNDDGSFDDQFADFDDVFGDLLDQGYLPGSDGKMYLSDSDDNGGDETEESNTGDNVLLRYQNGDSYRGAAVGGVREGFGAYFFADGGFYRGCFHADNYEGYGMLDEGNGKVYKGLWKDDKRCGYGEQTYADGEVYRGWWKDNRYHGFGRYEFANGEVCVGEFFGGMRHGISLMRRSNGKWYGKRWNNDDILPSPTGPRVLNTKDGSRYVGAVTERRVGSTVYISRHGFGEVRFSDVNASDLTDCYVGQFVNDSPCGTGVCILTKGDNPYIIASDDFSSNSLPEGECRMIWLSFENGIEYAEYYVGGFYDSKWCGRGTLYLIESGEYQDARLYGLKSGSVICCNTFDRGPDGFASVTDAYGEMRYGRFVDGLWKPNK